MSVDWFVHGFETDRYAQELSDAILATGNQIHLIKLPPFSSELPEPPTKPFVLYGGTRIIEAAAITRGWDKGVWYNSETFTWYHNWLHWTPFMLMLKWHVLTFDELNHLRYVNDDQVFVRPDADLKEFAGMVMSFKELLEWTDRLKTLNDEPGITMNSHTLIIVGDVIEIAREWRVFVVNGKPVECSRYRSYGSFSPVREFPDEVHEFINEACHHYLPAPVIVIDVGADKDGRLGIIEANCFNSSGWYNVDINRVVAAVSDYAALT